MLHHYWVRFLAVIQHGVRYLSAFAKWIWFAGITGAVGGFVGMFFHIFVEWATNTREAVPQLIYFLPLAGLIIVALYNGFVSYEDNGTDMVVKYAGRSGKKVPFIIAPLIFISTVLTHLCGGSAGREGAALQLGGSIGTQIGIWRGAKDEEMRIYIMCGMSALFSALFGTPITALFFAMEVSIVGSMVYSALIPCMVSSFVAYGITRFNEIEPTRFILSSVPEFTAGNIFSMALLAAMCAVLSIVFCFLLKRSHKIMGLIKNEYLRIVIGAALIIAMTLAVGNGDYNGSGMDVIKRATEGDAVPYAFLLKMIFTAVTIGAGYKGGEIVPTLFVGATFGCFAGGLIGFDPCMGAAIGMATMFCGVLNCPIASIFLSIELFGAEGIMYFVPAVIISYMLSGYYGLYDTQKFVYSKLRPQEIDK
ncbi:MAG: chloride channel protein [Firmicutes bacterium]|nr:chloride channel protein [Bacillota bacterium]